MNIQIKSHSIVDIDPFGMNALDAKEGIRNSKLCSRQPYSIGPRRPSNKPQVSRTHLRNQMRGRLSSRAYRSFVANSFVPVPGRVGLSALARLAQTVPMPGNGAALCVDGGVGRCGKERW